MDFGDRGWYERNQNDERSCGIPASCTVNRPLRGRASLCVPSCYSEYEYGDIPGVQSVLPSLSASDIETAMRFYGERRDEINRHIAENNEGEDIPHDEL